MRIKLRFRKKRNKSNQLKIPKKSLYALAVATIASMIWVNIGSITKFGLQIKIAESNIPTLINGITASTSLVLGIFIAILGIMVRYSIEKKDSASKEFYLRGMVILLIPVFWLWTTYAFLTMGYYSFAITYSLDALITALFVCIVIVIFTVVRIANQTEKEDPTIGDDF